MPAPLAALRVMAKNVSHHFQCVNACNLAPECGMGLSIELCPSSCRVLRSGTKPQVNLSNPTVNGAGKKCWIRRLSDYEVAVSIIRMVTVPHKMNRLERISDYI